MKDFKLTKIVSYCTATEEKLCKRFISINGVDCEFSNRTTSEHYCIEDNIVNIKNDKGETNVLSN